MLCAPRAGGTPADRLAGAITVSIGVCHRTHSDTQGPGRGRIARCLSPAFCLAGCYFKLPNLSYGVHGRLLGYCFARLVRAGRSRTGLLGQSRLRSVSVTVHTAILRDRAEAELRGVCHRRFVFFVWLGVTSNCRICPTAFMVVCWVNALRASCGRDARGPACWAITVSIGVCHRTHTDTQGPGRGRIARCLSPAFRSGVLFGLVLLQIAEFVLRRAWSFAGLLLCAPHAGGTPADRLVGAITVSIGVCHRTQGRTGLGLMLPKQCDVVVHVVRFQAVGSAVVSVHRAQLQTQVRLVIQQNFPVGAGD